MFMASIGNPRTWVPYINREDCSQGFCSLNCPQWCYIIFPPPPPLEFPGNKDSSSSFSPFLIAIVGILASAFLLVSYYAIISKYCWNSNARSQENQHFNEESEDTNLNTSLHEPWGVVNSGLEEGLIKSILVCKYKKGSGLIEGTECSVCLNEFQDGENLRLLPKCPHAFHVNCIDTWLISHSSCPLCRSDITYLSSPLPPPTDPATGDQQNRANGSDAAEDNGEINVEEMEGEEHERVVVIEIHEEGHRGIRRSFSMDGSSTIRSLRVADILQIDDDQEEVGELSNEKAVKHNHAGIKRSFSSGRLRLAG